MGTLGQVPGLTRPAPRPSGWAWLPQGTPRPSWQGQVGLQVPPSGERPPPGTPAPLGSLDPQAGPRRGPHGAEGRAAQGLDAGHRSTGTLSWPDVCFWFLDACPAWSSCERRALPRGRRTHLVVPAHGVGLDSGGTLSARLRGACGSLAWDLPWLGEAEGPACASRRGRAWPGYGALRTLYPAGLHGQWAPQARKPGGWGASMVCRGGQGAGRTWLDLAGWRGPGSPHRQLQPCLPAHPLPQSPPPTSSAFAHSFLHSLLPYLTPSQKADSTRAVTRRVCPC